MQVFKAACKVALKHPVYLLVYIVGLSMLGIFLITPLLSNDASTEYHPQRATVAMIDRDGSDLSGGIHKALEKHADFVEVEDTTRSLQDAVAQGSANYILIIPEGYEADFIRSFEAEGEAPEIETIVSYTSAYGTMMDQVTNQYLSLVGLFASADPSESMALITDQAYQAMGEEAAVTVETTGEVSQAPEPYVAFLKFSSYPLTVGIIVCVSILMAAFNKGEVRRRNLASPLKISSYNVQTALGCLMIALFSWAWVSVMGLVVFGSSLQGVPMQNIALMILAILVFVMVSLALGYLFAQLGIKENVANAIGNILGMVMSFLSGAWISLSLLGEEVTQLGHFVPSYWYAETIAQIAQSTSIISGDALMGILGNLGIILLFAAAIFVVALVAGRMRMQSTESAGNTAATRSTI